MTADLPKRLPTRHAGTGDDAFPFATLGEGPPVLWLSPYAIPIWLQWYLPMSRRFIAELATGHRVVLVGDRYAPLDVIEGDHELPPAFLDTFVADLVAVLDAADAGPCQVVADFMAALPAIALAARHPERVTSLLLWNGMLSGAVAHVGTPARHLLESVFSSSDSNVVTRNWVAVSGITGNASDARGEGDVFSRLKARTLGTREIPDRLAFRGLAASDVSALAPAVDCPTLIVSPEGALMPGRAANEALARAIPGARLAQLPGAAIAASMEDQTLALPLVLDWLSEVEPVAVAKPEPRLDSLTRREREVCQHIARGETNQQIANALTISQWTVQRHVSNAIRKTGAANRAELAALVATSPED